MKKFRWVAVVKSYPLKCRQIVARSTDPEIDPSDVSKSSR